MEEAILQLGDRIRDAKLRKTGMLKLRQNVDKLTVKVSDLECDIKKAHSEKDSLQNLQDSLLQEISEYEQICEKIQNGLQMRPGDRTRLTKAQENVRTAINLTGIRWDYAAPDNIIKGYIVNKAKGSVAPFQFEQNDNSEAQLWDIIESNIHHGWIDLLESSNDKIDLINKENIPKNSN